MLRYRLKSLLIVLALGPMVLAGAWFGWERYTEYRERQRRLATLRTLILRPDGGGVRCISAAPVPDPDGPGPLGPTADLDLNLSSGQFDQDGNRHPLYPDK